MDATSAGQRRVAERKNARLDDVAIMTYDDDPSDEAKQRLENFRGL